MKDEKILQEEILSDGELENVSGGNAEQVYGDSEFLNSLGFKNELNTYDLFYVDTTELQKAWKDVGVDYKIENYASNGYFIGDKEVSRMEAFKHAMRVRGWNDVAIIYYDWKGVRGTW